MTIKDVADRSGFSAPTLRYYEAIGLLPAAVRTPAGYRTYDDQTLARLAFIRRAKRLGCSLEEIGGLTTAWEGGRCGPIQDQLRQLVHGKLAAARAQTVELLSFTSDLEHAAAALERHRPDGACDETCGCVGEPPRGVATTEPSDRAAALGCTLEAGALGRRLDDWAAVLDHARRRLPIDGGVRVELADTVPLDELARLVAAEQSCCTFFRFAITVDEGGVALEASGPEAAAEVIAALFNSPPPTTYRVGGGLPQATQPC
jgi:DNA-binding transcriptional MerR regulator